MAVLGLHFGARAFSSYGKRGPLFIAVHRPLTIAASLLAEHRLQTRRLSNCGSQAQPLHGMWDPPRPGLEPVSPALAGRLSTTAPPGKPQNIEDLKNILNQLDQIDIYRHHLTPAEYFLSEHTKFTKIGYTLGHENSLNKFK